MKGGIVAATQETRGSVLQDETGDQWQGPVPSELFTLRIYIFFSRESLSSVGKGGKGMTGCFP